VNTRNIQTFLMVSATFFAMSAPVRSGNAGTLSNAFARTAQMSAAKRVAVETIAPSTQASDEEQNS
jgi:hypothetical protein